MSEINESMILQALDWSYEKAVNGLGVFPTAEEIAHEYLAANDNDPHKGAESLVRWQIAKAATSGFLTGIGGLITLPVAIPANISSVIYIQLRMIAAIAKMGEYDLKSDQVKSLVYVSMAGSAGADILKNVGIRLGEKITTETIKRIGLEVIKKINSAVGFRLMTKFGSTGIVNFGKMIPLVGGLIGGSFDAATTKTIGSVAIKTFLGDKK